MPQKHFYFSLGALVGTLVITLLGRARHELRKTSTLVQAMYDHDKHWFLYFPTLIFIFGCWGLVPDVLHATRLLPKDVTRSDVFDIFFFHSTFERIESTMPVINQYLNWAGEVILGAVAIGVMLYYIKMIKMAVLRHKALSKGGGK